MGTYIVIAGLVVIVGLALTNSVKHFKGEGGCCGGGGEIKENKKLKGKITAQKIISIEGMHCDHCKNAVERQINKIDGAAARVSLKKKIAVVSLEKYIPDEELIQAVERADFKVTGIELKEV